MNKKDGNFIELNITEYVKNHLDEAFFAVKIGYIKVRKAQQGEVIDTYTSGIIETSVIAKKDDYIAMQLDKNNEVFIENGHQNEWTISKNRLDSFYIHYKDDIYKPKPIKRKFIRVSDNISFVNSNGCTLLQKGGYLDVTDLNNIYGIQKADLERTYSVCKD